MYTEHEQPGTITLTLEHHDLVAMHERGYAVERVGFVGMESKTWVKLPAVEPGVDSLPGEASAYVDPGADLMIDLSRGFLTPLEIGRDKITGDDKKIEHYLGEAGIILIQIQGSYDKEA